MTTSKKVTSSISHSHPWIEIEPLFVQKRWNRGQIVEFAAHVSVRCPQKPTGHHSWTTSNFAHHFAAICEFELDLQFGNSFDRWPRQGTSPMPLHSQGDHQNSSSFSATNISSNIIWFLQLHDTIKMKSNHTWINYNHNNIAIRSHILIYNSG